MRVEKIYAYPVKSLRPVELTSATATRHGLSFDRRFMLVKSLPDGAVQNMHVMSYAEMVLFHPSLTFADQDDDKVDAIRITYTTPDESQSSTSLDFPLYPVTEGLPTVEITMHESRCRGFDMGAECNDWFSECFGFPVKLLYLGENRREVLMSTAANGSTGSLASWVGGILSKDVKDTITFADCAPFLIVSRTSLLNVSARLPDGEEMDITKFRPNLVVEGAAEEWEEDFWAELSIGDAKFSLVQNCARCISINVDYETGKPGLGDSGQILKKTAIGSKG